MTPPAASRQRTRIVRLHAISVHVDARPGEATVALEGELDHANADDARIILEQIASELPGDVRIDLAQLRFMGVCGVQLLRDLDQRMAANGRRVRVTAASNPVRRVLELTGSLARRNGRFAQHRAVVHCGYRPQRSAERK